METPVKKHFRMRIEVPSYLQIRTVEHNLLELERDKWTGLYYFPLFVGEGEYKPKAEDLVPTPPPVPPVVARQPIFMQVVPIRVGEITRFFREDDQLFVEGETIDDRIDFSHPNWECKLWWSPRFNNPRDSVTHVRFNMIGHGRGDVHALDPKIMEDVA